VQAPNTGEFTLRLEGIRKSYGTGTAQETEVLHGVDLGLGLARGEFAALIGPSGSGKSTLLNLIGLLDKPSRGKIFLTGQEAQDLPDKVGLKPWGHHLANDLSGGQQQRVAIARALVMQPALVLADEPTGNLDTQSANSVFDLLREVSSGGTTFLIITHDPRLAASCDRLIEMVDGRIESDKATPVARPSTAGNAA
jgi:lipoprotein-releasing system ATP-binding protein